MERVPPATSLLEELDRRQDEVLAQLDELEERLSRLLAEYSGVRPLPALAAGTTPTLPRAEAA